MVVGTDARWIRTAPEAFGLMLPDGLRVFDSDHAGEVLRWIEIDPVKSAAREASGELTWRVGTGAIFGAALWRMTVRSAVRSDGITGQA